ncbi:MAG: ATP-dependent sacrificial sulfur transferase LarE [Desulfocapsaceae bacterium]|jgi:uncharacterized protein|nr:ATP-dependent sacrificial sulfur transferase LarE [Desulfocapsaceae bacterium]
MKHEEVYQALLGYLQGLEQAVVAFSGGVDSSLLLYAAHQALPGMVVAVTVRTPYVPHWEIEEAESFAQSHSIAHKILDLPVPASILQNPRDRCYLCKKDLFSAILREAEKRQVNTILEGSNMDDLNDYRPGLRALQELSIVSPYLGLKITKHQIRELAKNLGLESWNKPSNACLLSRLPYGTTINDSQLKRISEAEQVLRDLQLHGSRVRSHGDIARVEVPVEQFADVVSSALRIKLVEKLKACGYLYVTLDLEGYLSGSMNRNIT